LGNVSVLTATIKNKTSVETYFKKPTTENNAFIVLVTSKVTSISCSFYVNYYFVQCVRVAAKRRTQPGDATDQRRDQPLGDQRNVALIGRRLLGVGYALCRLCLIFARRLLDYCLIVKRGSRAHVVHVYFECICWMFVRLLLRD